MILQSWSDALRGVTRTRGAAGTKGRFGGSWNVSVFLVKQSWIMKIFFTHNGQVFLRPNHSSRQCLWNSWWQQWIETIFVWLFVSRMFYKCGKVTKISNWLQRLYVQLFVGSVGRIASGYRNFVWCNWNDGGSQERQGWGGVFLLLHVTNSILFGRRGITHLPFLVQAKIRA